MKRYVGVRQTAPGAQRGPVAVYIEDRGTRQPLRHRVRHSPTGFEWNYGGSGPADLARSILWDAFGGEPTPMATQAFKWEFVARRFDFEGFVLDHDEVVRWADAWRSKGARFLTIADEDAFWALDPEFGRQAGAEA